MKHTETDQFSGRTLVIATSHGKEKILGPLLEEALGVKVITPFNIDTDEFGTFTGEIERSGTLLETARQKCLEACRLTGQTLAVATEAAFGAHPALGSVPACEEVILLKDLENDQEIKAKIISTQTNFSGNEYYDWEDLLYFTAQTGFPSNALTIRATKDNSSEIFKGITSWEKLKEGFQYFKKKYGRAYVETDMRAHLNSTRRKVVKEAGEKLIAAIQNACPVCQQPRSGVAV